jgi:hypothetical protein
MTEWPLTRALETLLNSIDRSFEIITIPFFCVIYPDEPQDSTLMDTTSLLMVDCKSMGPNKRDTKIFFNRCYDLYKAF